MDPVSAIGLAGSLAGLIQLAITIVNLTGKAIKAPSARTTMTLEIVSLVGVMSNLKQRIDAADKLDDPWFMAVSSLGDDNGSFAQLRTTLEWLAKKLAPRFGRDVIWAFADSDIKDALLHIERTKSLISLALQDDHHALSLAIKNDIEGVDSEISALKGNITDLGDGIRSVGLGVVSLTKDTSDQQRRSITTWLSPLNFLGRHDDIFRRRQEGTNRWLLESKEFSDWVNGTKKLLRCSGIPGAGKTTAASIIVEHLKSQRKLGKVAVLVIYCNYKEQAEQSVINLISSLVKQLLQDGGPLSDDLVSLYRRHNDRDTRPSIQEVSKILHKLIESYDRVFIVVDALDESPESVGTRTNLATELLHFRSEKCNLLFTARNYAGLESLFPDGASIEVAATDEDVLTYVDARIAQANRLAKHCRANPSLQDEIRKTVVGKTHGMFLLARLHMDALETKTTVKAVRSALNQLPTSLTASYDGAMDRVESQNEEDRDLAQRVLFWTTFAKRSLTILELRHALAVEEGETDLDEDNLADEDILLSVCCGLITVDPSNSHVRLVHYTLQTYFEGVRKSRFPEADLKITQTCLSYLSFDALDRQPCESDDQLQTLLDENPLLLYAAQYWGDHARGENETELTDSILTFLDDTNRCLCCTQIMCIPQYRYTNYSQAYPTEPGTLWMTASFGLAYIIKIQLRSGCDLNAVDSSRGHTALHRVARGGHVDAAKLLLEQGASTEILCSRYGFAPLRVAAQEGHEDLVSLLLKHGADVNTKGKDGKQPLHGAALKGLVATLRSLLDSGADIEMRDTAMSTALHAAAANGRLAAVEYLLDRSAAIEAKERGGRSPLHQAAANGHEKTTLALLRRGADPDSRDRDLWTPLSDVAGSRRTTTMLALLERGADVNARNMRGLTALDSLIDYARGRNEDLACMSIMLRWGANVNSRDENGFTALHRVSFLGNVSSVSMLLKHGADVNATDVRRETPTHQASWNGHTEVVHMLLEAGADVNARSIDGQTALHFAASNGHSDTIAELLGRGADSNIKNDYAQTAADLARLGDHDGAVQLFSVMNPTVFSPPALGPDWEVIERAKSLDLGKPLMPLAAKPATTSQPDLLIKTNDEKQPQSSNQTQTERKPDPSMAIAIAEANAKLSDPAVFAALNIDPEKSKIQLWGPVGFSLKATIDTTVDGHAKKYFMKTRINETRDDLYFGEYLGLQHMYEACPSSVPRPVGHGNFAATVGCFLITEYLEQDKSGLPNDAATGKSLAQKLAQMHLAATAIPEGFQTPVFGFPAVTYCGPTAQVNTYMTSWHDFFVENRMRTILQSCEVEQGSDDELRYWVERTINGPVAQLLADEHLGGPDGIAPAVVHGNLWYGNKMRGRIWTGSNTDVEEDSQDILFDPSSAWCHNEFELGILCLFGGFSAGFFQEYHALIPRAKPAHEYPDRIDLYELYHVLNHHALFGGEYRAEAISRMQKLCERFPPGTG